MFVAFSTVFNLILCVNLRKADLMQIISDTGFQFHSMHNSPIPLFKGDYKDLEFTNH